MYMYSHSYCLYCRPKPINRSSCIIALFSTRRYGLYTSGAGRACSLAYRRGVAIRSRAAAGAAHDKEFCRSQRCKNKTKVFAFAVLFCTSAVGADDAVLYDVAHIYAAILCRDVAAGNCAAACGLWIASAALRSSLPAPHMLYFRSCSLLVSVWVIRIVCRMPHYNFLSIYGGVAF